MQTSPLPHANGSPIADPPPDMLLPASAANAALDIDLYQRYAVAAQILARMVASAPAPARILELGPNYLNPLPRFLNPERAVVTRADVEPVFDDPEFELLARDQPLPFADESFDAVVALEVLEHMPAEKRRGFIAECLRVARHGIVLSCPDGTPEVVEAEAVAGAAFLQRHGHEHPYLREHREFGLPREEDVRAILREFEHPHAVMDNAPLDVWLPTLLLSENLLERQATADVQARLNQSFAQGRPAGRPTAYRKIYVCAKSFDATAALEPVPNPVAVGETQPESVGVASALNALAATATDAMAGLERDRHADARAHEAEVAGLNAEIAARDVVAADLRAQIKGKEEAIARVEYELAGREEDLVLWRRQHMLLSSYVDALTHSAPWKLLAPLRWLRQTLRPRGLDQRALIPWHQIVRHPKGDGDTFYATGNDGHFIVPCHLPAGWLRIRLKMTSDTLGRAELYFDDGKITSDNQAIDRDCVERFEVHGRVDRELLFRLPRPAVGVRFAPLDVPGQFRLEALEVTPLSPPLALANAVRTKVRLLWRYGLITRALGNGVGLLFRGRYREFLRKLHGGVEFQKKAAAVTPAKLGTAIPSPAIAPVVEDKRLLRSQPLRRLDIVYVLKSSGMCGGVKVVMEHVSRLHARGHNARVFFLDGDTEWFSRAVPAVRFDGVDELKQALAEFRGIKVATWYETAPWVAESLRPGDQGYYLTQDIEDSYAATPEAAAAALATYRLGLKPISEGLWVRNQLRERFGLEAVFVSIGLDFDVFQPRLVMRDRNRILMQARTWSGGGTVGARLKGWDTARETVLRCRELNPRTALTTFSIEDQYPFPDDLPHTHFQRPTDEKLSELYSQAGLYLMTSNHEGFGLPAAEAMACGCPVVATLAQGNEEFCIDGVTALTAPAGDVEALARKCRELQANPKFARELGQNARSFILNYTWDRVIDRLEREFLGRPGPDVIITRPTQTVTPPREEVDEDQGYRALADVEFGRDEPAIPAAENITGEYPDLQLPAEATADVTLVIPSVNDYELVTQCVRTCRRYLPSDARAQFIVVDDGTRDPDILDKLQAASKELDFELLLNHQNLGFSASVNRGMRQARGRYVVLCNNDVLFFQPWLEPLERAFQADPHLGIVGAKLLYPDGSLQHAGVDKVPGQLKWHHAFGKKPGDHPPANQSRYVWSVTGALYAIRRETLRRLGGLSTAYTTAYEDLDYSLRAWAHGVRVGYCSEVAAYHLEGGTRGATETKKSKFLLWAERERYGVAYFERKWMFLRYVENFQSLLSLHDRPPVPAARTREGTRAAVPA